MYSNQPDVQLRLVHDRHEELRRVAGRTRLRLDTRRRRRHAEVDIESS